MNLGFKTYIKIGIVATFFILFIKYLPNMLGTFGNIADAATPLIVGCAIAYILNLLMKCVEKIYFPKSKNTFIQKSRRPVSILLSMVLLLCILALIIKLVVPELVSSFRLIGKELPGIVEDIRLWLLKESTDLPALQNNLKNIKLDWPSIFEKVVSVVTTGAGGVIVSIFSVISSAMGTVLNIFIGLVFSVYLLANKEKLLGQLKKILKVWINEKHYNTVSSVAATFHDTFSDFIVGQCTEAVILGGLCAIGMMIFRFPYAVMTGTVVGVTALIPVAGSYIGAAIGAFMIFTVNPFQALLFIVFLVVLQQLEGNLIYPKVVGTSIGLPGMWVLAAITIGGGLMGVLGMLLGVPTAATLYKLFRNFINKRAAMQEASDGKLESLGSLVDDVMEDVVDDVADVVIDIVTDDEEEAAIQAAEEARKNQ